MVAGYGMNPAFALRYCVSLTEIACGVR